MGINPTDSQVEKMNTKLEELQSDDEGEMGWKIRVPDIKFTNRRVTVKLRVEKGPGKVVRYFPGYDLLLGLSQKSSILNPPDPPIKS
jgi:hypothetical protein